MGLPRLLLRQAVIVTGAARGIGRSIVQRLALEGAKILAVDVPQVRTGDAHGVT